MKLLLIIAAKDLRRMAVFSAALAVLLALLRAGAWNWFMDTPWTPQSLLRVQGFGIAIPILEMPLLAFLTFGVVTEDPLQGSRPFWVTRPIGGLRLLGAKVLVLLIALWIPLLVVEASWLTWCGGSAGHIAWALGGKAAGALSLSILAWASAVWVRKGEGTASLWAALGVVLLAVGLGAVWQVVGGMRGVSGFVIQARIDLLPTLVLGTAAAVVASQYLSRRTKLTFCILALGTSLCLGVWVAWPLKWSETGAIAKARTEPETELGGWATLEMPRWRQPGRQLNGDWEFEIPLTFGAALADGRSSLGVDNCLLLQGDDPVATFNVRYEEEERLGIWRTTTMLRPDGQPLGSVRARLVVCVPGRLEKKGAYGTPEAFGILQGRRLKLTGKVWRIVQQREWPLTEGTSGALSSRTWQSGIERTRSGDLILDLCETRFTRDAGSDRTIFALVRGGSGSMMHARSMETRLEERIGGAILVRTSMRFADDGADRGPSATLRLRQIDAQVVQRWVAEVDLSGVGGGR